MQWVVYGAGAVGGVLGGLLTRAAAETVLVARGEHLAAMRARGLRMDGPDGSSTVPVAAVGGAGDVDWSRPSVVLLTVKSQQTYAALQDLVTHAPPGTPVVCVQNGVSNEPLALRFFEHVLGTCVMMPVGHLEPGVVEVGCSPVPAILDTGRYPGGVDDLTHRVVETFVDAGIVALPRPDVMAWKHRKLVMNLGNAVQACFAPGDSADRLRDGVRSEGEEVLRVAGAAVVTEAADRSRRGDILQRREVPGSRRSGGSSWQSLQRATGDIETDYLNGEIVRMAREHGARAPLNEAVRRTAVRMARERAAPASLDAALLLA